MGAAISSGRATRFIGVMFIQIGISWGCVKPSRDMSVSTYVGATQLTRTPRSARSPASERVIWVHVSLGRVVVDLALRLVGDDP